jgi:hypothetical protein
MVAGVHEKELLERWNTSSNFYVKNCLSESNENILSLTLLGCATTSTRVLMPIIYSEYNYTALFFHCGITTFFHSCYQGAMDGNKNAEQHNNMM